MAPHEDEELVDDEPPAIEPYTVLGISKSATPDEIKSAYRKAALKHHPDKAAPDQKYSAHSRFQDIVFAYGVLSDPARRKRYDETGSTSESIDFDGFSWSDYYRSQFADVITVDSIKKFSKEYKGSIEEKDDVLEAYRSGKGKWSVIYEKVMLSEPLEDEERFRGIIDEGIENGEVKAYKAYTEETQRSRDERMRDAEDEGKEAMAYAEELGVADKLFGKKDGKKGRKKDNGEAGLAALIKSRQVDRSSFFDQLQAKYAPEKKSKSKKRGSEDEDLGDMPSEEAFQAAAARLKNGVTGTSEGRKAKKTKR